MKIKSTNSDWIWKNFDDLEWLMNSYGFLIQKRDVFVSGDYFANEISFFYDMNEPRNRLAYNLAKKLTSVRRNSKKEKKEYSIKFQGA